VIGWKDTLREMLLSSKSRHEVYSASLTDLPEYINRVDRGSYLVV